MAHRSIVALVAVLALAAASCSRDPEALKREHVANGDRYFAEKKYSEAVIEYRNAIAQDRRFGEARFKLARAYETAGDLRNALAEYIRAADLMPANLEAQMHAGKLLVATGRFSDAKDRALGVLAKDPKNINALIVLGNSLAGLKDIAGAVSQIEEAIATEPRLTFSYTNLGVLQLGTGNREAAEAAFHRAIKADPTSIQAYLNLGNYYWASGRRVEAEAEFKKALAIDAKSVDVNKTLAAFYVTGDQQAAAEPYVTTFAAVAEGANPKLGLADFYLSSGRTKEALSILQPLSKEGEGFRPAQLRLSVIEFRAGRRQEGYQLLEEILKRFPKDVQALVLKAGFLRVDGKLDEALTVANAVAQANPTIPAVHTARGDVLAARRSTDEAIQAFQRVLELAPTAVPAQIRLAGLFLARGDAKTAIGYLAQVLRAEPTSGLAHFLMGQAQLRAGDLQRAESELVAIAKSNPSSADAQTWLGRLYGAKDDRIRARQAFNAALKLEPDSVTALNGMVTLDLVEKRFDAVQTRLESRLAARPEDHALLFLSGNAYLTMGAYQRAELLFKKLLQLDSDDINTYARLARLYVTQRRLDEAKDAFEELARNQPNPVAATTMIGMILDMQGKRDEARTQYERALALDPQAAVAANNLASHYAERDQNLDVALQLAQTAKAKLPDNAQVSDTLGWVLYKKGLIDVAIPHLRRGVEQNPSNPNIHYHLGLAYSENGETANARRSFEQALKLNPQFRDAEDAKRALATLN